MRPVPFPLALDCRPSAIHPRPPEQFAFPPPADADVALSPLDDLSPKVYKSLSEHVHRKRYCAVRKTVAGAAEREGVDTGPNGRSTRNRQKLYFRRGTGKEERVPADDGGAGNRVRNQPLSTGCTSLTCTLRLRQSALFVGTIGIEGQDNSRLWRLILHGHQ